ncbi:PTS transporter subunit EIIC [Latilactobacillus sakei]
MLGLVAFLVPKTILAPASIQAMQGLSDIAKVNPAFGKIEGNVLIGIIAGLIAVAMYNRFHNVKLPMALSFFSGKRLVPIMAATAMMVVSAILYFVWPTVFTVLVSFGEAISKLGLGWCRFIRFLQPFIDSNWFTSRLELSVLV